MSFSSLIYGLLSKWHERGALSGLSDEKSEAQVTVYVQANKEHEEHTADRCMEIRTQARHRSMAVAIPGSSMYQKKLKGFLDELQ